MDNKRAILVIMDGWGLGKIYEADAIRHAKTPFVSSFQKYPHSELITCGEQVGLPEGQMGNSEVGHLNIGAGRIVYQELLRINLAIRNKELAKNKVLVEALQHAASTRQRLHFLGLVSDGGVHSHIDHLKALTTIARQHGLTEVFIHAFTDGRDTDPKSGIRFLRQLQDHLDHAVGKIATITGRYYSMDRDKRWERVRLAYEGMVEGKGAKSADPIQSMQDSYDRGVTDEFIKPIIATDEKGAPLATIRDGDLVICFNFRTDRCREITTVLTQKDMPEAGMHKLRLDFVTMTEYDKTFRGIGILFDNADLSQTLGEVLEEHSKTQIRIAETEKYPHVSFFFSGGRESEFRGERRIMIPSPKVATYDLKPEMSAPEVTAAILPEIREKSADFICLNFANADMVGHTGVWNAVIRAVETVDQCVGQVVEAALKSDYRVFLTSDHGNSDYEINKDGTPNTAHSMNPVPFFIISTDFRGPVKNGKLADIAPTILHFMGVPIPKEMTGNLLV